VQHGGFILSAVKQKSKLMEEPLFRLSFFFFLCLQAYLDFIRQLNRFTAFCLKLTSEKQIFFYDCFFVNV